MSKQNIMDKNRPLVGSDNAGGGVQGGAPNRPFGPMGGRGPGGGPGAMLAAPAEKARDFKGTLRRLAASLSSQKGRLALVAVCGLLATTFSVAAPKVMGEAVNELFRAFVDIDSPVNLNLVGVILLALAALYLLSSLFRYVMGLLMARVAQETVFDLRNRVAAKLHRLPVAWFDGHSHGDVLSRVTNDLDTVANTLQQSLAELMTAFIGMLGVSVMMLLISPLLMLVTILVLPLSIFMTRTIARTSQRLFIGQQKVLGALNGHVEEMISGHMVVKAFGGEAESLARFQQHNSELYLLGWKANFISGLIMPLMHIINNLGYILVAVIGGLLAAAGSLSLGDIQAFIQYSKQFGQPVIQISQIVNVIQSTVAAAERVFEVLDEKEMSAEPAAAELSAELPADIAVMSDQRSISDQRPISDQRDRSDRRAFPDQRARGAVQIEQVCFSYKADSPLIENLNVTVRPGQSVAIVGPTGAGKTTLVNLLMRFYELNSGRILVDGVDTATLPREQLRSIFGMVLQDTWLFNGSIRANIAYGHEGASEDQIVQAAVAAQADHFIRTLPEGYDTVLNEEANNISEGQRQLLTIARAFLTDPAILILDEATSSVDTRTELHIQQAMRAIMKGRTSFVIAHRLSTIRDADLILVMNEGRIVETGTHKSLLAAAGFYADLFHSQFG